MTKARVGGLAAVVAANGGDPNSPAPTAAPTTYSPPPPAASTKSVTTNPLSLPKAPDAPAHDVQTQDPATAAEQGAAEPGVKAAQQRLTEFEAIKKCQRLPESTTYYVAACVTRGMELDRRAQGFSDAKAKMQRDRDALQCLPAALNELQAMAQLSAEKIYNSDAISKLMDFPDAMNLECKKSAAAIVKID